MRGSEFNDYGVGVVLYFKFLKFLTLLFLFMTVMSCPSYLFYFNGNKSDNAEYTNMKYLLASFSLGNIGQCKF